MLWGRSRPTLLSIYIDNIVVAMVEFYEWIIKYKLITTYRVTCFTYIKLLSENSKAWQKQEEIKINILREINHGLRAHGESKLERYSLTNG